MFLLFSACANCVVIPATSTKSLIIFSSFEYLASKLAWVPIASSSPFVGFYESHTVNRLC